MINFKPQKGKAYDKLPKKTLEVFDNNWYLTSVKYDGNQIFITNRDGYCVRFFTSDWKEFSMPNIADELVSIIPSNSVLVAEMNYNADGKLGDRTIVQGKITTERVNFNKGLPCSLEENLVKIRVFDTVSFNTNGTLINSKFVDRIASLYLLPKSKYLTIVENTLRRGREAIEFSKDLAKDGWEGCMCMDPNEYYNIGKRVNHAIKLKSRPTADLKCIGIEQGKGKYEWLIGSLLLEDLAGRVVKVGSGLSDTDRDAKPLDFIGKVIEIEYEQILDTYIQPTFVRVREDKEID